jgi:hypothetical protein
MLSTTTDPASVPGFLCLATNDTDRDRQEAIRMALLDPEGALSCWRAIAAERGLFAQTGIP